MFPVRRLRREGCFPTFAMVCWGSDERVLRVDNRAFPGTPCRSALRPEQAFHGERQVRARLDLSVNDLGQTQLKPDFNVTPKLG